MKFKHLEENNQSYLEHFKDSMSYSFTSLKCSGYFFIHAFFPDIFTDNGSSNIENLNSIIRRKSEFLQTMSNSF